MSLKKSVITSIFKLQIIRLKNLSFTVNPCDLSPKNLKPVLGTSTGTTQEFF